MNKKKAIILNSGGFDSVTMINMLATANKDTDFISLFFDYGQNILEEERKCARGVANKFNLEHMEVKLPKIQWSNSAMFNHTKEIKEGSEYLEMRNVIFLSYALSLAESVGADSIYLAILKDGTFPDTKESFVFTTREYFTDTFNIDLETPFLHFDKKDISYIARGHNVQPTDFFSCNFATGDKPCGVCGDCLALDSVYDVLSNNTPIKEWCKNGLTPTFETLFMQSPIDEVRLLINNKCQFNCSHCFYGFTKTTSPDLSFEEMCKVIDQSYQLGVKNIHFSGKEPLFDGTIFKYAKYIKEHYPKMTYDVVTNGVNVGKYINDLEREGFKKVYLSVDSLDTSKLSIRPKGDFILYNIEMLHQHNIEVEIFIDIHKNNYKNIPSMVKFLNEEYGVEKFFIRTVCPIGSAKNLDTIINVEELAEVYEELKYLDVKALGQNLDMVFYTHSGFTKALLENEELIDSDLWEDLMIVAETSNSRVSRYLDLITEFYCSPGDNQVTVTSDGYLLGCATEVSSKVYAKLSGGNLRDINLKEAISNKRKQSLDYLRKVEGKITPCYHSFYKI